jgi:hypothetical protein
MARNMYKSAMATGLASGKMRASMYDMASLEGQKKMEDIELSLESEKLNRNIGVISDTLSLASTVAGRYGDISEDVSTIESKYGEMEQPEGMFGKMIQSAKIGLGVGEYKFGEETIAAKDIASTAAKVTQQSMFDEAMKTIDAMNVPDKPKDVINSTDKPDVSPTSFIEGKELYDYGSPELTEKYKYIHPSVFNPPKATAEDIQKQRDQLAYARELQLNAELENLNLDKIFEENYKSYEGM